MFVTCSVRVQSQIGLLALILMMLRPPSFTNLRFELVTFGCLDIGEILRLVARTRLDTRRGGDGDSGHPKDLVEPLRAL